MTLRVSKPKDVAQTTLQLSANQKFSAEIGRELKTLWLFPNKRNNDGST
jgi:hypothetical protein